VVSTDGTLADLLVRLYGDQTFDRLVQHTQPMLSLFLGPPSPRPSLPEGKRKCLWCGELMDVSGRRHRRMYCSARHRKLYAAQELLNSEREYACCEDCG
jgi:hypothetical protein